MPSDTLITAAATHADCAQAGGHARKPKSRQQRPTGDDRPFCHDSSPSLGVIFERFAGASR